MYGDMDKFFKELRDDLDNCGIKEVYVGLVSDLQRNATKKKLPRILFKNKEDMHLYKLVGKYPKVTMEVEIII